MTLTLTITGVAADVSAARAKTKTKTKTATLGSGHFTISKKGAQKLTIHLSSAGKRLLAKDHGKLKATVLETTKIQGLSVSSSHVVRVRPGKK